MQLRNQETPNASPNVLASELKCVTTNAAQSRSAAAAFKLDDPDHNSPVFVLL
jgi:hypothetical protein